MTVKISHLAHVDPRAHIGENVEIGPFCCIGPDVTLGDGCELQSHVTIAGHTTIGERNRFFPGAVIGGEPQDSGYKGARPAWKSATKTSSAKGSPSIVVPRRKITPRGLATRTC